MLIYKGTFESFTDHHIARLSIFSYRLLRESWLAQIRGPRASFDSKASILWLRVADDTRERGWPWWGRGSSARPPPRPPACKSEIDARSCALKYIHMYKFIRGAVYTFRIECHDLSSASSWESEWKTLVRTTQLAKPDHSSNPTSKGLFQ